MNIDNVYKTHPDIVFTVKEGTLKLIYLDEENNNVVKLVGPAAEALQLFDGKRTLWDIKKEIDQKFKISNDEAGFQKMIDFFIKKQIIQEV